MSYIRWFHEIGESESGLVVGKGANAGELPGTGLPAPPGDFTRTLFSEIFPGPLSPVFLSTIQPLFKDMLDFAIRALGFEPPQGVQAIGTFYSQPYLNRDYLAAAFQPLSPATREPLIAQIVNPSGSQDGLANFELSWPYLRMVFNLLRFMLRFPQQLPGILATYQEEIAQTEEFPCQVASDREVCDQVYRLSFEVANKLLRHDLLLLIVIGRSYRLLGALLQRYYHTDTGEVVARLTLGVSGDFAMETNQRLWDLAQSARCAPSVNAALRENDPAQARWLLGNSAQGREFLQAMGRFLDEFGHRESRMDILYPTWREDPEPVYSFVRSYLDADESQNPYRQQERLAREREQLTSAIRKDVRRGIIGRLILAPLFEWILKQIQVHTQERDTLQFEMRCLFPPIRRLMLELGERWQADGLLEHSQDIFYLEINEMVEMAKSPRPAQDTVRARKDAFSQHERQAWPEVIRNGEESFGEA